MRDKKEIIKAIEDSKKFAKEQKINYKKPLISFKELEKGLKALAVANEICTLKWVLGKGKLNCYTEEGKNKK